MSQRELLPGIQSLIETQTLVSRRLCTHYGISLTLYVDRVFHGMLKMLSSRLTTKLRSVRVYWDSISQAVTARSLRV